MTSPSTVQWSTQVLTSKSKRKPFRPVFQRHGTSEVAVTARDKLNNHAGRDEHDLRQLVGHANTLDYLVERLEARQRKREAEPEPTAKTEQSEDSQDRSLRLSDFPDEHSHTVSTEQTSLESDNEDELNPVIVSEQCEESSYFDLRGHKVSPALSIVALLDSGSESDESEEDDAASDSQSDADSSDDDFAS